MPANTQVQERLRRLETGLATRFSVSRRELRDWAKLGGLAAAIGTLTAMAQVVLV